MEYDQAKRRLQWDVDEVLSNEKLVGIRYRSCRRLGLLALPLQNTTEMGAVLNRTAEG